MLTSWDILIAGLIITALFFFLWQRRALKRRQRDFNFEPPALDSRVLGKNKWELLTDRQKQVARLAAHGLSNAEIGMQLGISVNTVDAHLKKVYFALGVRSRTGLSYDFKDYVD